jgi:23S rRNA (guanosine2251-2'-O)-methyltransferase
MLIYGMQPVLGCLEAGKVTKLWVARDTGAKTTAVLRLAETKGVPVELANKAQLESRSGTDAHQGVVAEVNPNAIAPVGLDVIIDRAESAGEDPVVLLLDGVTDPHNLGAIMRSALALGAHGVVLSTRRSARVNATVVKASAGAALALPYSEVPNLKNALLFLHSAGLTSYAAVLDGAPVWSSGFVGPAALVLGGEGGGVRPSLVQLCHERRTIPLRRGFDSLNVSVAAAILLYELVRDAGPERA